MDSLHGCRSGTVSIIAAPNPDCTILSGVLIFPGGKYPLAECVDDNGDESADAILSALGALAPDMKRYITSQEALALQARPISSVLSVYVKSRDIFLVLCLTLAQTHKPAQLVHSTVDRMHVGDFVVLLGDAAHAVSASLGQGCNAALQDVDVFSNLLVENKGNWASTLTQFTATQLTQAHALGYLSTHSKPRTLWMRFEWISRMMLRKLLPASLQKFLRPMPMDLLTYTNLSYVQIQELSSWWCDRVKASQPINSDE